VRPEVQADPDGAARTAKLEAATGRLMRPAQGVISQFMERGHTGIDIGAPFGSPIVAADDGIVRAAGWIRGGGFRVCVGHAAGLETCYFHTAGPLVGVGERVRRGQAIALVGMSGLTRGPHVHWEAKFLGRLVDPLQR
jgi:murein DD-endopeptidase MepM/ murein hydrolase activator NlpD